VFFAAHTRRCHRSAPALSPSPAFAHFIIKRGSKQRIRRDDVTRAVHHQPSGGSPNPVETAVKIAFAYTINHSPKTPFKGISPGEFQRRTVNDGEVERTEMG
jgi:hypothetical protein